MSDTINTIVDKSAFEQVEKLARGLKESRLELIELLNAGKGQTIKIQYPSDIHKKVKQHKDENEQLNASLKEQDRIEKALIKELEKKKIASEATNKVLIKTKLETQRINKEAKEQAILSSKATGEYEKQSLILNKLRKEYKNVVLEQGESSKAAIKLRNSVQELDEKLKAVDASVGQYQRNVGNYESAWDGLGSSMDNIKTAALEGDLDGLKEGFAGVKNSIVAATRAAWAFIATPIGATVAAIAGIGATVAGIVKFNQSIKESNRQLDALGVSAGEMSKVRSEIQATADTFEKEFFEIAQKANSLSKTFGISMSEANDVIAKGLADGGRYNTEFLDSLLEYDTFFERAGYSAQEFVNVLNTGFELGVYTDKLPDALKEADLSLREQTDATKKALVNAFGASFTDDILSRINNGTTTVKDGLIEIAAEAERAGLSQQQQAQLTADVFRGAGEDAGGALKILEALGQSAQKELSGTAKAALELQEANEDLEKAQAALFEVQGFDELWSKIKASVVNAIAGVLEGVNSLKIGFQAIFKPVKELINQIPLLNKIFSEGKGILSGFFSVISINPLKTFGVALKGVAGVFTGLVNVVSTAGNQLATFFTNLKDRNWTAIKEQYQKGGQEIADAFSKGYQEVMDKEVLITGGGSDSTSSGGKNNEDEDKEVPPELKHQKGSIAAIEASISALKEQRDNVATTREEVRQYNDAIAALQKKLDELNGKVVKTEVEIVQKGIGSTAAPGISATKDTGELERYQFQKNEEAKTKILEEESQKRRELIADTFSHFAEQYGIDFSAFENLISKKEGLTKGDYVDAAASAAKTIVNLTRKQYDQELQMAAQQRDAVLNNEKASDKQKLLAKEQYEKEVKKIKREQAEDEKRARLFEIAINTASAVVQALPNIPLSILAGALGAAQLAFVASQPIPKFKDGHLLGTYEGTALVNDAPGSNYKEVVENPDGSIALPQKRNTLIDMKRGTKVYKNYDEFLKRKNYNSILNASLLTSLANQSEKISSRDLENHFNMQLRNDLQAGIKEGFRNIQMNVTNNNENSELLKELKFQRRRDAI